MTLKSGYDGAVPNPFRPSFGVSPPLLVGRDDLIDEFAEALEDGPGSAARATIYTGARGSGKTVMLNAVEDRAREHGWVVISDTASPGFVDRIVRQHLPGLLRDFDPKAVRRRLTGITGPLSSGGATQRPPRDVGPGSYKVSPWPARGQKCCSGCLDAR
jgi:hypothetical protein